MSSRRVYILTCDGPDCRLDFIGSALASETRTNASALGWSHCYVHRPNGPSFAVDACPEHAAIVHAHAVSVEQAQ